MIRRAMRSNSRKWNVEIVGNCEAVGFLARGEEQEALGRVFYAG